MPKWEFWEHQDVFSEVILLGKLVLHNTLEGANSLVFAIKTLTTFLQRPHPQCLLRNNLAKSKFWFIVGLFCFLIIVIFISRLSN